LCVRRLLQCVKLRSLCEIDIGKDCHQAKAWHCFDQDVLSFAVKEIGVSLGHRLQLLRAIAELTSGEKEVPKPAVASAPSAAPQDTAERR
jgi:hypothetical protein